MDALTHARNHAPLISARSLPTSRGSDAAASDEWVLVAGATSGSLYLRTPTGVPLTLRQVFRASPATIRPSGMHAHTAVHTSAWVIAGARPATGPSAARRQV
jgi:hypothetical protein